ncbi:MAG: hypothetical protein VX900_13305 [Pseudomonadota bacterium]|nr:hypothetical protein [Pseudomonadota bacterium]
MSSVRHSRNLRRFGAPASDLRYRRHAERWRPHHEKSKAVIEEAVSNSSRRSRAVVLGSGPLFDIPVEALADAFDVLELVDIVHPKRARQIAAGFANVELKTSDVSGAADPDVQYRPGRFGQFSLAIAGHS